MSPLTLAHARHNDKDICSMRIKNHLHEDCYSRHWHFLQRHHLCATVRKPSDKMPAFVQSQQRLREDNEPEKHKTKKPPTAASAEPLNTPSFTAFCRSSEGNARPPINRLMVKPIPQSRATPYIWTRLAPSGHVAQPHLTASQDAPITPTCLPMNNPAAMPSGTGASRAPTASRQTTVRHWPARRAAGCRTPPTDAADVPADAGGCLPCRHLCSAGES